MNPTESTFTSIYQNNGWRSSVTVSGPGSTMLNTRAIRSWLPSVLKQFKIKSLLDGACGDLNWMKTIDLGDTKYIGSDVVLPLIESNREKFPHLEFLHLDITKDTLPDVDCILLRDCLQHFSYEDLISFFGNVCSNSNIRFMLATSFFLPKENSDIRTGMWRPLNLTIPPLDLSFPIVHVIEDPQDSYEDKILGLWSLDSIRWINFRTIPGGFTLPATS